MKQLLLMLLVSTTLFTACKKDETEAKSKITITTAIAGKSSLQSGVRVRIYAGVNTTASSLVNEGLSSSSGSYIYEDYVSGFYTVSASWTDNGAVPTKTYMIGQNHVLETNVSDTLALVLACINCCDASSCVNGTAVQNGSNCFCDCDAGYEGVICDTLVRTKFIGTHSGNEACSTSTDTYSITISVGATDDAIVINNLYAAALSTQARFTSNGSFTISSQSFGTGTISGSGNMNASGKIQVYFVITVASTSDACTYLEN